MAKSRRLNKDNVLETAVHLVNQHGDTFGLTLTRLAEEPDIRVPSPYTHIAGRQEIQRDLARWGLAELRRSIQKSISGKSCPEAPSVLPMTAKNSAMTFPACIRSRRRLPSQRIQSWWSSRMSSSR